MNKKKTNNSARGVKNEKGSEEANSVLGLECLAQGYYLLLIYFISGCKWNWGVRMK